MPPKKICLIGFMGSGKTSVSHLLASQLKRDLIDMDRIVLERSGCSNIAEIFEVFGEEYFRQLESDLAISLRNGTNMVISTGGGAIINPNNVATLKENMGVLIFLQASFAEIVRRVESLEHRPLFKDLASAKSLYHQRQPIYRKYADYVVDTDGKTPGLICSEILGLFK